MDITDFTVIYLGGSIPAMENRYKKSDERVIELKKLGHNVTVIFTGFDSEIDYFKKKSTFTSEAIEGDAYDSVSNLRSQIKRLLKAGKIVICTGYYHWLTIWEIIIPENFPELLDKVEWLPSGEIEGIVGKIRFYAYKILRSKTMEKLAIFTRWKLFIDEFLLPLYAKANADAE